MSATDRDPLPAGAATQLSDREAERAERRSAVSASVVHEAIRREGEAELLRPPAALFWSGVAAGLSMGFSLAVEGLLAARLPDAPWRSAVSSLGYSVGFLIVVLGRQQLFTENTLTVMLPLLTRRDGRTLQLVARLWAIVLGANLVGALAFGLVAARLPVFSAADLRGFDAVAASAMAGDAGATFLRAIFAGWLIALMVWLLPAAEAGRVWIIVIITYVVALGGFAHIIAGSVEGFYAVARGLLTAPDFVARFLVPTLVGNVLGGVSLVAALNHAQVVAGDRGHEEDPGREEDAGRQPRP